VYTKHIQSIQIHDYINKIEIQTVFESYVTPLKVSLLWHSGGACVIKWSRDLCWQ